MSTHHTRTYSWDNVPSDSTFGQALSGLEVAQGILAGTIPPPPIARTMDFRLAEVEPGRAVFAIRPEAYLYNPAGVAHGGVAATILDSALSFAILSLLPARTGSTTIEIKVNYIRPVTPASGELRCEGRVLHVGGRVATAEGSLVDAAGKIVAHSTTTHLVLRPGGPAS